MRISDGDHYPPGDIGELAVCFYLPTGGAWEHIPVGDRSEADEEAREVAKSGQVFTVMKSPLVWIARCTGGNDWEVIWTTNGGRELLAKWGDEIAPDCEFAGY